MLHLNKIITIFLLLLFLGCNINNTSNDSKNKSEVVKNEGTVNISIPNISPRILESLAEIKNSRAVNYIDKIEITATKNGVSQVFSSDLTLNEEKKISIILEEGDYTISAKIYNLKVSETDPVVSGSEDITIISNQKNYLNIVLTPCVATEIAENTDVIISEPSYTEYRYTLAEYWSGFSGDITKTWIEEITSTGKEYWYEITPTSNFTEVKLLTQSLTSPPALISMYDQTGKLIRSMDLFKNNFITKTVIGEKYYICVLPIKTVTGEIEDCSETITFKVSPPEIVAVEDDGNNSVDTAIIIGLLDGINGNFNSPTDSDFYKLEGALDYNIYFSSFGESEDFKINIIDGETVTQVDLNEYIVVTSDPLVLEVVNLDFTYNSNYSINIQTSGVPLKADAYENDNTSATATTIEADGSIQNHSIHVSGDEDFMKVSLESGVTYAIHTVSTGINDMDTELYLYDLSLAVLEYNDDNGSLYSTITYTPDTTGDYYLKVIGYSNSSTGHYGIKVEKQ